MRGTVVEAILIDNLTIKAIRGIEQNRKQYMKEKLKEMEYRKIVGRGYWEKDK